MTASLRAAPNSNVEAHAANFTSLSSETLQGSMTTLPLNSLKSIQENPLDQKTTEIFTSSATIADVEPDDYRETLICGADATLQAPCIITGEDDGDIAEIRLRTFEDEISCFDAAEEVVNKKLTVPLISTHNDKRIIDTRFNNPPMSNIHKGLRALGSIFKKLIVTDDKDPDLDSHLPRKSSKALVLEKVAVPDERMVHIECENVLQQLGTGGHSTVCLARRTTDSKTVVCKFINEASVWHWHTSSRSKHKVPLEIQLMKEMSEMLDVDAGIVRYFEHFEFSTCYVIVMEYLGKDWVDLYDYIEMFGPVNE
ncbi:hypothetical protein HK096_008546, partial [Nowakowskiella sp. JEL0078]